MIYHSDNEFKFWSFKAKFHSSEDGDQEAFCNDKVMYEDMAKNYSWKFSNMIFSDVVPTEEQKSRLERLNQIEAEHKNLYEDECILFVQHGAILPETKSEFLIPRQEEFNDQTQAYVAAVKKSKVPQSVTMRQARLALHENGLLVQVDTAIESLEEPDRTEAKIEWEYATSVDRNKSLVEILGPALGLSEEELDDLFILAATL